MQSHAHIFAVRTRSSTRQVSSRGSDISPVLFQAHVVTAECSRFFEIRELATVLRLFRRLFRTLRCPPAEPVARKVGSGTTWWMAALKKNSNRWVCESFGLGLLLDRNYSFFYRGSDPQQIGAKARRSLASSHPFRLASPARKGDCPSFCYSTTAERFLRPQF